MTMLTSSGTRSEMNVTPYIDVLLVLLIAFMLLMQRFVIKVNLANEAAGGNGKSNAIVLELTNDGRYLLNTVVVPAESLAARLHEVFAVRNDKVLFLKSGAQRFYSETIRAADIAKGAGVEVVALAP